MCLMLTLQAQTPIFDNSDYQKALWMTTRFYGAQRMGNGVNWLTEGLTWDAANDGGWLKRDLGHQDGYTGKSFTKDADGSYDLTGGWFDCGDHVLFGQTFFYSAYMLLLGYSEFTDGYGDLYSTDYHGYINSGRFCWEDKKGVPNGIPDILDECKYATDWIMKAVRDNKTFYYQKGKGDYDHLNWATSVMMTSFNVDKGGEYNGTRDFAKASEYTTSMAALAGAALAVMGRVYADYDATYARNCIDKAEVAYDYVMNTKMGNSMDMEGGKYYPAKPQYLNDITTLCAELYRATGNSKYLDKCNEYTGKWINNEWNHNFVLNYNNTQDISLYAYCAMGDGNKYSEVCKSKLKSLVDNYPQQNGMLHITNGWGELRYNANAAFAMALYSKLSGIRTINSTVLKTVEYVMGNNSQKFSYIVGFDVEGGISYPHNPHHRNFFRSDCGNEEQAGQSIGDLASYRYRQLGYMVGGSINDGYYVQTVHWDNYKFSEGGIDYNAGLVGALGYLNSLIAPVQQKEVMKIEMYRKPANTNYTIGDKLLLNGAQIKVTYTDNSVEYKDVTEVMVSGFSSEKVAEALPVTVTYGQKATSFTVNIVRQPTGIEVSALPKTEYIRGEGLSVKGGMIHYIYNDGSYDEVEITSNMITGFSSVIVGVKTLTITYKTMKTTYDVTIAPPPVTQITLSPSPAKKTYQVGETLDITGGKIKVYYQGGEYDLIDITEDMVSGFSSQAGGKYTISVKYAGKETQYDVQVEKHATSLSISELPKTLYSLGESLSVEGGKLTYSYNDGTADIVDMEIDMVTGFNNNNTGIKELTVNYQGMSTIYEITFIKAEVASIEIEEMPHKTIYNVGEALEIAGAKIKVNYQGAEADVLDVTPDMISGYNANKTGDQNVTIEYMGQKTTFQVRLISKPTNPQNPTTKPENPNTPVEIVPAANVLIYSHGNTIFVKDYTGLVEVFSMSGAKVYSGSNVNEISLSHSGIYIVKAGMAVKKVALHL